MLVLTVYIVKLVKNVPTTFILSLHETTLVPYARKEPHTKIFPVPNFTVDMLVFMFLLQTWCVQFHLKNSVLLLSHKTILSQCYIGLFKCSAGNFKKASKSTSLRSECAQLKKVTPRLQLLIANILVQIKNLY